MKMVGVPNGARGRFVYRCGRRFCVPIGSRPCVPKESAGNGCVHQMEGCCAPTAKLACTAHAQRVGLHEIHASIAATVRARMPADMAQHINTSQRRPTDALLDDAESAHGLREMRAGTGAQTKLKRQRGRRFDDA